MTGVQTCALPISTTTKVGSTTATNPAKKQKIDAADASQWKAHLRAGGGGGESEKWFTLQGQYSFSIYFPPSTKREQSGPGLTRLFWF